MQTFASYAMPARFVYQLHYVGHELLEPNCRMLRDMHQNGGLTRDTMDVLQPSMEDCSRGLRDAAGRPGNDVPKMHTTIVATLQFTGGLELLDVLGT